jgi:hypothetical protein
MDVSGISSIPSGLSGPGVATLLDELGQTLRNRRCLYAVDRNLVSVSAARDKGL